MSNALLLRRAQRNPLTEVREARQLRTLQTSAIVSCIAGVTATAVAFVTIGLGA
jgi:hypothetical protein